MCLYIALLFGFLPGVFEVEGGINKLGMKNDRWRLEREESSRAR
jgi:hypothetical protein